MRAWRTRLAQDSRRDRFIESASPSSAHVAFRGRLDQGANGFKAVPTRAWRGRGRAKWLFAMTLRQLLACWE